MNCENCGAPMKKGLDGESLICEYCSSTASPEMLERQIQWLKESSSYRCPFCGESLESAALVGAPAAGCRKCGGVLLEQEAFLEIVEMLRAQARGPGIPPRPIDPQQLQRAIRCPKCVQAMTSHPYLGPGNFIIDICDTCRLVWLDKGELTAIALAPGRDRNI